MIMMLFWPIGLLLLVLLLVPAFRGHDVHVPTTGWEVRRDTGGRPQSAVDILRERYARGEIDRVEYEEKLRVLS